MENAVDALKMAFAIFILIMALSLAIYMFTQARETADIVLQSSDITEFMDYTTLEDIQEGTTTINSERIVGLETIIPTLYKYYKENYTVIFQNPDRSYMTLYNTQTNVKLWSGYGTDKGYINRYYKDDYDTKVCAFDVDDETRRHEPWTGGTDYYKQNLDMFLSGGVFTYPDGSGNTYNYGRIIGNGGFIEKFKGYQFRESLGEYTYNSVSSDDVAGATDVKGKTKRVIIYTLLN